MTPPNRWLRDTPWTSAAAVYAWCAAVVLTVLIEPSTLLLVAPPALVASAPLVVQRRHQPLTTMLAAVILTVWAVVGMAMLGPYFLPSVALLVVEYVRSRRQEGRTRQDKHPLRGLRRTRPTRPR